MAKLTFLHVLKHKALLYFTKCFVLRTHYNENPFQSKGSYSSITRLPWDELCTLIQDAPLVFPDSALPLINQALRNVIKPLSASY